MKARICAGLLALALFGIVGTATAQFVEKKTVSLALAQKMAAAAEAEATKNNWTMVITVVDDGGKTSSTWAVWTARRLAALKFRRAKRTRRSRFAGRAALEDLVDQNQPHLITLPHVTAVQGGLPIMLEGKVVGAIGVSGGTSAQDEQCAQAGLNAIGDK